MSKFKRFLKNYFFFLGHSKECDLVLEFAKSLFPRESSPNGEIWRSTQIYIDFLRALHQTDWTYAEQCIKQSLAFSKKETEPLFLKLQLYLAQGNDQEGSEICQKLTSKMDQLNAMDKVRCFLYQAEIFCLTGNYTGKKCITLSLFCSLFVPFLFLFRCIIVVYERSFALAEVFSSY